MKKKTKIMGIEYILKDIPNMQVAEKIKFPPFRWSDLAIIIFIIGFLVLLLWIGLSLKQDTLQCLTDPINYTMEKTGWLCGCWGKG